MLKIEELNVSIEKVGILRDVALAVPTGEMAGLIGRNGAGKTTLMRSVMGLIPVQSGLIRLDETDLTATAAYKRARLGIGYMPEDRRLVPDLLVEDNILLPAWAAGRDDARERLDWIYGLIPEVADLKERRAMQLSGGQQKLAALARALMCGTRLLLLDEPFEGVAPALARRLVEVIADLKGGDISVLLSESDYTQSAHLVDHVFVIERGAVRERREAEAG